MHKGITIQKTIKYSLLYLIPFYIAIVLSWPIVKSLDFHLKLISIITGLGSGLLIYFLVVKNIKVFEERKISFKSFLIFISISLLIAFFITLFTIDFFNNNDISMVQKTKVEISSNLCPADYLDDQTGCCFEDECVIGIETPKYEIFFYHPKYYNLIHNKQFSKAYQIQQNISGMVIQVFNYRLIDEGYGSIENLYSYHKEIANNISIQNSLGIIRCTDVVDTDFFQIEGITYSCEQSYEKVMKNLGLVTIEEKENMINSIYIFALDKPYFMLISFSYLKSYSDTYDKKINDFFANAKVVQK